MRSRARTRAARRWRGARTSMGARSAAVERLVGGSEPLEADSDVGAVHPRVDFGLERRDGDVVADLVAERLGGAELHRAIAEDRVGVRASEQRDAERTEAARVHLELEARTEAVEVLRVARPELRLAQEARPSHDRGHAAIDGIAGPVG